MPALLASIKPRGEAGRHKSSRDGIRINEFPRDAEQRGIDPAYRTGRFKTAFGGLKLTLRSGILIDNIPDMIIGNYDEKNLLITSTF